MNFLVLLILTAAYLVAARVEYFVFKNGTAIVRGKRFTQIEGHIISEYIYEDNTWKVGFAGVAVDSMTPLLFYSSSLTDKELNLRTEGAGFSFLYERTEIELYGSVGLSRDPINLTGDCYESGNRNPVTFNMIGSEVPSPFYAPKEAGYRAKNLIGQNIERYRANEVIAFAITGAPYIYKDCGHYLTDEFPPLSEPAPGVIIVGRDGKHCAILDNEGTKFVHSNPAKKVVTLDSIALINTYFPNGISYRGYPEKLSLINS